MLGLVLVIWGLSVVAGAMIAQSKNREPWLGALAGLGLGVIGLVIIALLPKLPDTKATT